MFGLRFSLCPPRKAGRKPRLWFLSLGRGLIWWFIFGFSNVGCFTVLLLPTQIPEQKRWQIFAYNRQTTLLGAYNIEQSGDGLFNTRNLYVLVEGGVITREVGAVQQCFLNLTEGNHEWIAHTQIIPTFCNVSNLTSQESQCT